MPCAGRGRFRRSTTGRTGLRLPLPQGRVLDGPARDRQGAAHGRRSPTQTTACTRCFGCRSELERMLRLHLGDAFHHEPTVTLPPEFSRIAPTRPMYIPVLAGFRGAAVDTRVIVFNWEGPEKPVSFRADLLRPDGVRVQVWNQEVAYGCSGVIDLSRKAIGSLLPGRRRPDQADPRHRRGGLAAPVFPSRHADLRELDAREEGTGEPEPPERPQVLLDLPDRGSASATRRRTSSARTRRWSRWRASWSGRTTRTSGGAMPIPRLEFDQSACVALHEHFPAIATGAEGGAVRLSPATHAVAGFMIRHEPEGQLWRVQHL